MDFPLMGAIDRIVNNFKNGLIDEDRAIMEILDEIEMAGKLK
jgi:hypothetical protein